MIKKYFKKKSKFSIAIDIVIAIMLLLLLIPGTRKDMAALILKPTLFLHQPSVNANKVKLAEEAYSWQLQNADGITFTMNDFKDKVVLINLWATWCPPCIAEMPDLQNLYNDYSDKMEFLFVSNEQMDIVQEFMRDKEFTLPAYSPLTAYPAELETNSIPATFIINKDGEIVVSKSGVAKWNSKRMRNVLDILISK